MNENYQSQALTLFDLNQKIRRSQIKAAVAMAFIMGINLTVARYLNYKEDDASWTEYLLHFSYGLWASAIIWGFNIYLNNPRFFKIPYAKTHPQQIFALKCALSIGFGIVMMAIWSEIFIQFFVDNRGPAHVFELYQYRGFTINVIVLLLLYGIEQFYRSQQALVENEALKRENITAQFEVLKQQVNPHFLFNSLNILKTMVKAKEDQAEEYVLKLSEVYRYLLQSNLKDKVHVSEELSLLESYSYMLKVRFEDNISLEINLNKEANNSWMPPLILQLLVENCVKHNVVSQNKPLKIELFNTNEHIIIRNNLQPKRSVEPSTNIGLENLKKRYGLLTEKPVLIHKTEQYFEVLLPII